MNSQLKMSIRHSGHGILLSPGQELHRGEALALWHHVGHPPQDTHLDWTLGTFVPHHESYDPCVMIGKQQLETRKPRKEPNNC